jgi:hypothetical protein
LSWLHRARCLDKSRNEFRQDTLLVSNDMIYNKTIDWNVVADELIVRFGLFVGEPLCHNGAYWIVSDGRMTQNMGSTADHERVLDIIIRTQRRGLIGDLISRSYKHGFIRVRRSGDLLVFEHGPRISTNAALLAGNMAANHVGSIRSTQTDRRPGAYRTPSLDYFDFYEMLESPCFRRALAH